jgi:hypothetical protein
MPPWHGSIATRASPTLAGDAGVGSATARRGLALAHRLLERPVMKPHALVIALSFAVPVAAYAGPTPGAAAVETIRVVDADVRLRTADGKVSHDLRLTTIDRQCAEARAQDGAKSFDVELCHRYDTAAGRVLQIKWSLLDGKRTLRHEAWAVLAAGGSIEVGAARGTGDTLIVSVK